MADINERYRKAAAFSPMAGDNGILARLLINAQAPPPVGAQDFNAPLPPALVAGDFQQPAAVAPPVAPPPAVPPATFAPPAPMAPMPSPTAIASADQVPTGMDPANADVRRVLEEMQRRAFQNGPAPWAVNQGSLRDQTA